MNKILKTMIRLVVSLAIVGIGFLVLGFVSPEPGFMWYVMGLLAGAWARYISVLIDKKIEDG